MKANVVSMPPSTFMSVGMSANSNFDKYIDRYNQHISNTEYGKQLIERGSKVFNHVVGKDVMRKAKEEFVKSDSSVSDTDIYNMKPGTYETANKIMVQMVMTHPEMVKRFNDNTINAYSDYEYTENSVELEERYYEIVGNTGSSDDEDMYTYIRETSHPDDYEEYTATEKSVIRDIWNHISITINDGIDPVTGESI